MDAVHEPYTCERSTLSEACFSGDLEKVRHFLSQGAHIHPRGTKDEQPIIKALQCKKESRSQILELLIEHGADVNYGSCIPLRTAIQSGNVEGLELLITAGAELNISKPYSYEENLEPVHAACTSWPQDKYSYDDWVIRQDMKLDDVKKRMKILRLLLEAGVKMDYYILGECGDDELISSQYALHTVCEGQTYDKERMPPEMLELLIYYGADVNKQIYGETALHVACHELDIQKIKLLANYGADVNKPDPNGFTPIQICTARCRSRCLDNVTDDIVRFLAEEKGANIHVPCPDSTLNLLALACLHYDQAKLPIVLYYLSRRLPLQPLAALHMIKKFGLAREEYEPQGKAHFMPYYGKEILSIFLIDNALVISRSQSVMYRTFKSKEESKSKDHIQRRAQYEVLLQ